DEQIARRAAPPLFALRCPRRAEHQVREARERDAVGEALRDARRVPRRGVASGAEERPRDGAEVERARAGARLVEARAEPPQRVLARLERAQRRGEIGRRADDDLVEKRWTARGARVAGEDERVAAALGDERPCAVGALGGE